MGKIADLYADVKRAVNRFLAPTTRAEERAAEKAQKLVGIPEGHSGPMDPRVNAQGAQPDWKLELGWSRRYTVDRAQQAHAGNMLAGAIIERNSDHVVGLGYPLEVQSGDKGFNKEARLKWEEWSENPKLCDAREQRPFMPDLLGHSQIGDMRDGDSLFVMRSDGKVRLVNSIEIASPVGAYWTTREADGVEMNADGVHQAYWIHQPDGVLYSNIRVALHTLVRVPAKDCVFSARTPLGPQQTRGTTAFLGGFRPLEHVDGLIYSVAGKAQVAARLAMVITKKSPIPSVQVGGSRNPITQIDDGTLTRLEPDEDIKPVQGADPSTNLIEFAEFIVRIASTRWGLSLAMVILDFSDQRLSDARATAIETNKIIELQQDRRARVASEVRAMKMVEWIRKGELGQKLRVRADRMPEETLLRSLKHEWRFPARPLIDPLKERQADLLSYDLGATTLTEILARENKKFGPTVRRQARERDKMFELGLPGASVRSNLSREEVEEIVTESSPPDKGGSKQNGAAANGANRIH